MYYIIFIQQEILFSQENDKKKERFLPFKIIVSAMRHLQPVVYRNNIAILCTEVQIGINGSRQGNFMCNNCGT